MDGPQFEVIDTTELANRKAQLNASSVVLFDSAWLAANADDPALGTFLDAALGAQAKLAAVGGNTSVLFEILEKVRAGVFDEGRNPAYDQPALAGYRLRDAQSPSGGTYQGGSVLIGSPQNGAEAAEAILAWN